VDPYQSANYTIATTAPTASFDFEVRYNLLDQLGNPIKKLDLIKFLEAIEAELNSAGGPLAGQFFQTAVSGTNYVGPQI